MKKLVWLVRWKDLHGWHYYPASFASRDSAAEFAHTLPVAWPIDLVPELVSA